MIVNEIRESEVQNKYTLYFAIVSAARVKVSRHAIVVL